MRRALPALLLPAMLWAGLAGAGEGFVLVAPDGPHVFAPDQIAAVRAQATDWGGWAVHVRLTAAGAERLALITGAHVGQPLAIVVQEQVLAEPVVREPILGGQMLVSGGFDEARARRIAAAMGAGPGPWERVFEELRRLPAPRPPD